ncbi:MAG: YHS domain-containing protein [Planctomycetota bacterium]|jgi:YHS domain-containing protein
MNIRSFPVTLSLFLLFACAAQGAQRAPSHYNLDEGALAISGYDPVAYFPEGDGAAKKGKKALQVDFGGALYRFATEANRQAFLGDPERFEPRFGGWCAWAMIEGEKVEIDPKSYLIEEGTLHLFYDGWFADTRKKWSKKGGAKVRPTADKEWLELSGEASKQVLEASLGLEGLDPLSFAPGAMPVVGSEKLTTVVGGVRYRFSMPQNRLAFMADSNPHVPGFGGYDANALAAGKLVPGKVKFFLARGKELLLFESDASRKAWASDAKLRAKAERKWQSVLARGSR